MFKCFGHLLGYCIRAKSALDLHFPPIFWKDLLGESLNMSDLDSVCFFSHKVLKEMEYNGEIYDASKFDNLVESERFVTYLTNGVQVELCPGGKDMPVTHSNYKNYIDLVKKVKLSEGCKQMEWIKEGINEIVDLKIMMLLTWEQLESRACGVKTIQTEHFKSITKYNVDKDHAMVKMFWKMFESFTQEERAMYLRFVWGRNRLPFDCSRLKDPH